MCRALWALFALRGCEFVSRHFSASDNIGLVGRGQVVCVAFAGTHGWYSAGQGKTRKENVPLLMLIII